MTVSQMILKSIRKEFVYPSKDVTHFFPGHMARGLGKMQQKLRQVDCIIEVLDARVPFSGRNPHFRDTLAGRPHLLVLNKMDLVDKKLMRRAEDKLRTEYNAQRILYTNCKQDHHVTVSKQLIPELLDIFSESSRFNRVGLDHHNLMVIGLPNVGKSSLINALRRVHMKKGKATRVGPHAGVTRSVLERIRVCDNPLLYVFDSPGIMMPNIKDMEVGMKLALCATLTDHIVGHEMIADFMLFWLNSHGYFKYVDYFNLPEPTDNILEFLSTIAKNMKNQNSVIRLKTPAGDYVYKPNFNFAAKVAVQAFREGHLGLFNLDEDIINVNHHEDDLLNKI